MVKIWLLLLINMIELSSQGPIILDSDFSVCKRSVRNQKKNDTFEFTSKIWIVKQGYYQINFTFCGMLPNNSGCEKSKACLLSLKEGMAMGNFGSDYDLVQSENLKSVTALFSNGTLCKYNKQLNYTLEIHFIHSESLLEEPTVEKFDECVFHLQMIHPSYTPKCTLRYMNQLIDLRQLKNTYFISKLNKNFSLTLCDKSTHCGLLSDISSCEVLIDGGIIPLSAYKNERVKYSGRELTILGHTNKTVNNDRKDIEILLKCKMGRNLKFATKSLDLRDVQTQGHTYHFKLETPFGCIKIQTPLRCIVHDQLFIYNLTDLYYKHMEPWTIKINNNGTIFLNVCGPLNHLGLGPNSCTDTYAQVCHVINDTEYINKGFEMTNLEVDNDIVRASIENGFICKEDHLLNYKTIINFKCSEIEQGPLFVRYEDKDCTTIIYWETPHACPRYNKEECSNVQSKFPNCAFSYHNNTYDLSPLTLFNKTNYIIHNEGNSTQYLINICGPVYEENNPCLNDAVVVKKHVQWVNPKNRYISMGKISGNLNIDMLNNSTFVWKFQFGTFCHYRGEDYSSEIQFECGDKEERKIVTEDDCFTKFIWKTKYACPISSIPRKCTFLDAAENAIFNFTALQETSVNVTIHDTKYLFDICSTYYTECSQNCINTSLQNRTFYFHNNSYFISMMLPKNCSSNYFNKVILELVCDSTTTNEHFITKNVKDCILQLKFVASKACIKSNIHNNCSIPNKNTGFAYPLEAIETAFKAPVHTDCPSISYNNSRKSIELLYLSSNNCPRSEKDGVFYHKIVLHCSTNKSNNLLEDEECHQTFQYNSDEFCDFFESHSRSIDQSNKSLSVGLGIGIVLTFLGLVLLILGVRKYGRGCLTSSRRSAYSAFYFKLGDE